MHSLRILAVCIGNVCRSPMIEHLLRDRLPEGFSVASAGVRALAGASMDEQAAAQLVRLGGAADGFVARDLDVTEAGSADLILAATAQVRSRVLEEAPTALHRTFTLRELAYLVERAPAEVGTPRDLVAWAGQNRSLAAGQPVDLADPFGREDGLHREVADQIDQATAAVASTLRGTAVG